MLVNNAKARRKEGLFAVEGIRIASEIPENMLKECFVSEGFAAEHEISEIFGYEAEPVVVSSAVFKKMSDTQNPQGILCVCRKNEETAELMKKLAYTDILSGIPNRHFCDRKIAEIAAAPAYQTAAFEYTIFMMDIDSLGEINEAEGFAAGDEAIRCIAEAISDAMRGCGADLFADGRPLFPEEKGELGDCFFGRWGGDEFVACTLRSQADAFLTTLTSRIAAINIEKRIVAPSAEETLNARGGDVRHDRRKPAAQTPAKREPSSHNNGMRLGASLGNETVQTTTD